MNPVSGDIFSILAPNCDTDIMSLFIENFSNEYQDYRNIMIMDKAGWHTTSYLKSFDNVRYIFLPPYSPELNPTEHLWAKIRDLKFRNITFNSMNEVMNALIECFEYLDENKDMVSKLTYFKWLNLDVWKRIGIIADQLIKVVSTDPEQIYVKTNRYLGIYEKTHDHNRWNFNQDKAMILLKEVEATKHRNVRTIAKAIGKSRQWVYIYLEALASIGAIEKVDGYYQIISKERVWAIGSNIKKGILKIERTGANDPVITGSIKAKVVTIS